MVTPIILKGYPTPVPVPSLGQVSSLSPGWTPVWAGVMVCGRRAQGVPALKQYPDSRSQGVPELRQYPLFMPSFRVWREVASHA